jgi:Cof subfamily protein (haloacid dehalogenase superfamily)
LATPRALFAVDLDGTLVDRQDRIHPRDREAIAAARARGIAVTIATGRLTSRTHPIARELALDAPLVCADGGVIAESSPERVLLRRAIAHAQVEAILNAFADHELCSFVFTHEAIHSCERGRAHHAYVAGWARDITTHADVLSAEAWRCDPEATVMIVGIGPEPETRRAEDVLVPAATHVDSLSFGQGSQRVLRFVSRGTSKGTGLAEVARRLGLPRERVAVVGDWYNDVPMFGWAGRSFAMAHAPDDVKATATDVLADGAAGGGAVAQALEAWLAEVERMGEPGAPADAEPQAG